MATHAEYKQARSDFEYLVSHHNNHPYDMTGGYSDGEAYEQLLKNPTKTNACKHYVAMITYSATWGFDNDSKSSPPDLKDEGVVNIYRRYRLEEYIKLSFGVHIHE